VCERLDEKEREKVFKCKFRKYVDSTTTMVESLTCFCWQASSAAVGVRKESGRFEEE
jgi:hypothetical protein